MGQFLRTPTHAGSRTDRQANCASLDNRALQQFSSSFKKLISRRSSTSIPGGYQSISVFCWLKQLTAVFVGDIEAQNDSHASTARQVGRIGVTFVTLVAFVAMAVALFTNAVPSSRTVRDWASNKDSQGQMVFNFEPSDAQKFKNDTNQICFCRNTNINWPDYVAFFPLTLPPRDGNTNLQPTRGPNITDWGAFCESTILDPGSPQERELSLAFNACLLMVEAAVAPNISQTCLESASLIDPSLLNDTIASRVTGGLDQIWWNYRILQSLNNATRREYDQISWLHSLWTVMVAQFNKDHMSSYQDYWNAANSSGVLAVMNGSQTALGMEVQWYSYANRCNPPFCDIVQQNSWLYRAFLVVAQVGGLSTLVLVFVRVLLWPAFRQLFGWPLLSRTEQAHLSTSGKVTPAVHVDNVIRVLAVDQTITPLHKSTRVDRAITPTSQ